MYSFESTASSQDDILLEKVFHAGCYKNFVGTGLRKTSKWEIKKFNISELTDRVFRLANCFSYPLLSTYCLGILRIYKQSVNLLLEDLQKVNNELNSVFIGIRSKSEKVKGGIEDSINIDKHINIESMHSMELCKESAFIHIFQRDVETDQNLLQEMDILEVRNQDPFYNLGDFGDEIHLKQQIDLPDEIAQPEQSIIDNFQITDGGEIYASTPVVVTSATPQKESTVTNSPSTAQHEKKDNAADDRPVATTPKRKTFQVLDETPTKRQKKLSSHANGYSEEKRTIVRKLFESDGQGSSTSAHEKILDVAEKTILDQFHEHMPVRSFNEEAHRSSSHQIQSVQEWEQNRESMTTVLIVPEGAQLPPCQSFENIDDDLQLEELTDESVAAFTPKRYKRLKQWQDKIKQIEKLPVINQREKFINVYTRRMESTRVNLKKQRVVDLFSLPATRMNPRGPCYFGKNLLNLYFERARPILLAHEDTSTRSSVPRDINVNKRPRLSTFKHYSRQTQSGDRNVTLEGDNVYNEYRDRTLMPPPPSPSESSRLPEIHTDLPILPALGQQQSPQQQLPGTPSRRSIRPDAPGVSPRQSQSISNNFEPPMANTPDNDLLNPPALPLPAITPEENDRPDPQPYHIIKKSPSSISITSADERSLLMDIDEFYQFLKNMWVVRLDKVYLDNIIPLRPSLVAFFRYFVFLQRLQKAGQLIMLQEVIYGRVHIIKEKE